MKKLLLRGGVLLGFSALLSKVLGLWRDRLVVQNFPEEAADLIYAAFRIPDFFYYLLVGATVSVIFLPRLVDLKEVDKKDYFASFLCGVLVCFGLLSLGGMVGAPVLAKVFAGGFAADLQLQVASLAQWLFGSVFLLALSSVFAAQLQAERRFIAIAMAPLVYMGSLAVGLFLYGSSLGINIVGFSAVFGALLHLCITSGNFLLNGGRLRWRWKAPEQAWNNFWPDFLRRVFNNAAFQINQSVDVLIASFLTLGAVTSFTLGTGLGHFLVSIVGMSVMSSAFPKLTAAKHNYPAQKQIWLHSLKWIWLAAAPASLVCAVFSTEILQVLFSLSGTRLEMADQVFWWTVISLPFACSLPVTSRIFLANDDTITPLYATITGLTVATSLAAYLSLVYLPPGQAILGLALGNFTANLLGFILFMGLIWLKYERHHA